MNERDIAKKISQHLNYGANQLDRSILLRLQSARQQALELHAKPRHAFGLTLAGATGSGHDHGHGEGRHYSLRFWLSLATLLAGLLIATNWQAMNGDPLDDVDATLLAADLPVHAYLDSDFDTWLEQSSRD
ncbi:MAG: DUF3619 family protein [Sulfurimicrobium sp.]|nr:DUF3619 family protein [Sulfurimicrobium sp.]